MSSLEEFKSVELKNADSVVGGTSAFNEDISDSRDMGPSDHHDMGPSDHHDMGPSDHHDMGPSDHADEE